MSLARLLIHSTLVTPLSAASASPVSGLAAGTGILTDCQSTTPALPFLSVTKVMSPLTVSYPFSLPHELSV